MEVPAKFRSIVTGFRYWLLALIFITTSAFLVSCGGGGTTIIEGAGGGGIADTLVIIAPTNVETGSKATISVLATADGVAVNNEAITFAITDNLTGSNLSASIVPTVNGVASVTYTAGIFNVPETDEITISSTNVTELRNINVTTTGGGIGSVTVTADSTTLEAVAVGNNQTLVRAEVRDINGALVDNQDVIFETTAGTICTVGAAEPTCVGGTKVTATTNEGLVSVPLQSSTNLETATIQAQAGFMTGSTDVTFIPGPPSSFALSASPVNITADGNSTSTVTTLVRDSEGHFVSDGKRINFSVDTANSAGTGSFPLDPSDLTVGSFATQIFTAGTTPGDIDIQVSSGGATGTAVDLINLISETVDSVTVTAVPDNMLANGAAGNTVVVQAYVTNTSGFPINPGTQVTFSTIGGLLEDVSPQTGAAAKTFIATTDALGNASVFLSSDTLAGQYFVTATAGGRSGVVQVDFTPGLTDELDFANTNLTVSPIAIPADGFTTATITLNAVDVNDNPVADGTLVRFFATDGTISTGELIPNETTTSSGVATATITSSTTGGTVDLWAVIDGKTVDTDSLDNPTQIDFDITDTISPNSIELLLTGGSDDPPSGTYLTVESPAGSDAITIKATVYDASGGVLAVDCADNITFDIVTGPANTKIDGNAIAAGAEVTKTTVLGVASASLTAGTAPGTVRVKVTATQNTSTCGTNPATDPSVSVTTTAITIASGPANSLLLFPESELIDEDNAYTGWVFNAQVKDTWNNPVVEGTAVTFELTTGLGTVCPTGFTGEDAGVCVGETITGIDGIAYTKVSWPPEAIWTDFTLIANTAGIAANADTYPSTYPAVADIQITPTLSQSNIASPTPSGATTTINVSALYTDGSTAGGANPISYRYLDLSSNNGIVSVSTNLINETDEFGWTYGGVLTVGCVAAKTTVVITASDDGGVAPSPVTVFPYSGTANLVIEADPAGCP